MNQGFLEEVYIKEVYRAKIARILFAFIALLALVVIVAIIFMFPSYFILLLSKNELARRLQTEQSTVARLQLKDMEDKIKVINNKVKFSESNELKRKSFSKLIGDISNISSGGVRLESFELKKNSDGLFVINLHGKADTRDNFLSYVQALKNLPDFSSVNSPISNILPSRAVNFSLDVAVKSDIYHYNANSN